MGSDMDENERGEVGDEGVVGGEVGKIDADVEMD